MYKQSLYLGSHWYVPISLFCTLETISLPAVGLSSRSRLRGTQGARVYTRRKFGPRLDSVVRAVGVQIRVRSSK